MPTTEIAEPAVDAPSSTEGVAPRPRRSVLEQGVATVAGLIAAAAILAILAGLLGRLFWVFELASHFRFQYLIALAAAALLFAVVRRWRQAAFVALCTTALATTFWPLYRAPTTAPPAQATVYRAMAINVLTGNRHFDEVKDLIRRESPDFVVLAEVTQTWADELADLADEYPYAKIDSRPGAFGIALFSRVEPEQMELYRYGRGYRSAIVAQFILQGHPFSVVGTHPYPPRSRQAAEVRTQQLAEVANVVNRQEGDVLLLGDLNTTSWSPLFADLTNATGLHDSRNGFGRNPSWPSPLSPALRIAIDHALVSDGVCVHDRRVGPPIGSDHLPIVVDFSLSSGDASRPEQRGNQ
ncbi:MAG: endonuclease/exonuclease/phosphatase family protein [Planctomycetales bacterium]|nr:endonuclease/exonuclease/phosphatase family protein [Planctomycetales bacterium]